MSYKLNPDVGKNWKCFTKRPWMNTKSALERSVQQVSTPRLERKEAFYGAVVIVRKSLHAQHIKEIPENHISLIQIKVCANISSFLSIYCRNSKQIFTSLRAISLLPGDFFKHSVMAIDTNVHSNIWNRRFVHRRGEISESFFTQKSLNIMNSSSIVPLQNTSFVDVTLTGDDVTCTKWKFLPGDFSLTIHQNYSKSLPAKCQKSEKA